MSNLHKGVCVFAIMLCIVVKVVFYYSPVESSNRCIELSDKTDGDICNCLHQYGLTDTLWCGD